MSRSSAYTGYRSFSYLEPDRDYRVFELTDETRRVEPYLVLEKRRGVKIRRVAIPSPPESPDQVVSLYEKAITPKTRAIMISHMTYVTGLLMPMKEISEMARRKGVLTSVDGAHPLGMIDLDLHQIGRHGRERAVQVDHQEGVAVLHAVLVTVNDRLEIIFEEIGQQLVHVVVVGCRGEAIA